MTSHLEIAKKIRARESRSTWAALIGVGIGLAIGIGLFATNVFPQVSPMNILLVPIALGGAVGSVAGLSSKKIPIEHCPKCNAPLDVTVPWKAIGNTGCTTCVEINNTLKTLRV
jgi:hypothetical protein